ncbi:MAG TPA: UDP-glucose 4-epimerase GalE [Thermomicrobiales bacterium]|nr:UDP-glucose 4-epimerase GalE [Thermomicrobiales bacterium]
MRVLVTGGGGYIGSVAVERLIDRGYDVTVLDNFYRGHRAAIHPKAAIENVDIRDGNAVRGAIGRSGAEAIMHFAALTIVPESVRQPGEYFATNTSGGLHMLEAARDSGITRFVFSSTAAVYGEPDAVPIPEDAPKRPISPYGQSKWMLEQMLESFANQHGVNHAIFRYFNVAGASVERGEDHDPETHLIPVALKTLMGQREKFTVFGTDYETPDGTAIRDYVHVVDLVDAHIAAVENLDEPLGAMNLGTAQGFSVQQIVDAVQEVTGRELPVSYGPRREGDPAVLIADSSRARELLGWSPSNSTLERMIGSAWDWFQRFPDGYGA